MRVTADLLRLELRRRLRDPLALLTWTAIPLLMVGLLTLVFGPKGTGLPRARLLVVDQDRTFLSQTLVSALSNPRLEALLEVELTEPEPARRAMDRGRASALLEIPAGFAADLLANRPVRLELLRNPAETILPELAEEVLAFLADGGTALRAVLVAMTGDERLFAEQPSLEQVTALSASVYTLLDAEATRRLLDPKGLAVTHRHPPARAASRSAVVGWFAPGFLIMALLFLAEGQSSDVQEDAAAGRLLRAFSFPTPPTVVLGAKALSLVVLGLVNGVLLAAAFAAALGWRPALPAAVAATLLAAAAALVGLALLLRGLTRTLAAGNAATGSVMIGLGFLGGCFMPIQLLPDTFQTVARFLPTGWAVEALRAAQSGDEPAGIAWRLVALLLFAGASLAVATRLEVRKAVSP